MIVNGIKMQNIPIKPTTEEIDFREIFFILWAYKFLIILICLFGVIYAGLHALKAPKKYTSEVVFKLGGAAENEKQSLFSSSGIFIPGLQNQSILPLDELTGQVFIKKIDKKLNFKSDPFFYKHNSSSKDSYWKTNLKILIGWEENDVDPDNAIWSLITKTYKNNVSFEETGSGAISISVSHSNPNRAAIIANTIMETTIANTQIKKKNAQDNKLKYLAQTLSSALNDLELSQSKLKLFAMENRTSPLENFQSDSYRLEDLRLQLSKTSKLYDAAKELVKNINKSQTSASDYDKLSQKFPIIDQVEFRRVLGQNEIISSWVWPEKSLVLSVLDTLRERQNALKYEIDLSQINAQKSEKALETFAKLQRDAKIAETSYGVLIDQVKRQSIVAGYQPDGSEIFEYASIALAPSSPNHKLILVIGAGIGLALGCVISIILGTLRGVFYSRKSLLKAAGSVFNAKVKVLYGIRKYKISDIEMSLKIKHRSILRDLSGEINKSKCNKVIFTSCNSKFRGNDVAKILGIYLQAQNVKICIINFSQKPKVMNNDTDKTSFGPFYVRDKVKEVTLLNVQSTLGALEILGQRNFLKDLNNLDAKFDLIFISADNNDAISLLRALKGQEIFHISLANLKRTKSNILSQIRMLAPIKGLLHD
jgi:uncharacterized protein involved in exopolysaccharide biosynthesis